MKELIMAESYSYEAAIVAVDTLLKTMKIAVGSVEQHEQQYIINVLG